MSIKDDFTPTPEQQACVDAYVNTTDNLLISALAGAAKTSTLVLMAKAMPKKPTLSLAFNKRIADEMRERLPANCTSMTLNSIGHRAWGSYLGKRLNLDDKKIHRLVTDLIKGLSGDDKDWAWENLADLKRAVSYGKSCGWVPSGHYGNIAKPLMLDDEFFAKLEEEPSELVESIVTEATIQSLHEAMQGTIDFDDQVLMPTVFPAVFDFYPVVLVDESQDLSALNHAMLRKIAKKRLIAVGDPLQAIYGFRGAHEDSMQVLAHDRTMTHLGLTTSFRCPVSVVEEARWHAPHMQYPEWAKPGSIERPHEWSIEDIPDGDVAIICRNNAPLFTMAIRMLRDGRYPELVGNEIGKTLIKQLGKMGPPSMPRKEVLDAITKWEQAKLEKAREEGRIRDQAACLRVFAMEGETLGDAVRYAERVMEVAGPVKLMTGHKAKGLEFDTVFILDKQLLDLKGKNQDKNLLYVMQTRSKNRLIYVTSENYTSVKDEK